MKNRQKVFDKISLLIDAMNREVLGYLGIKFEKREAYAVDYVSELLTMYKETTGLDATSMRLKRDYMGNDQLLPAYNLQAAICDESGINCYPSGSAAKS